MKLLITFTVFFCLLSQVNAQLIAATTAHNGRSIAFPVDAAERFSLANKFNHGVVVHPLKESTIITNSSTTDIEKLDPSAIKKTAINLQYQNDELLRENQLLKQKLAFMSVAYQLNQNYLHKQFAALQKLKKDLIVVDHFFEH